MTLNPSDKAAAPPQYGDEAGNSPLVSLHDILAAQLVDASGRDPEDFRIWIGKVHARS